MGRRGTQKASAKGRGDPSSLLAQLRKGSEAVQATVRTGEGVNGDGY